MATTIDEVAGLIEKQGWKLERLEGRDWVRFGFTTEKYVDTDGDAALTLIAEVMDEGQSWRILAPRAYLYEDGPNSLAMLKAILYASRASKFASWSLDLEDGEIQISVRSILGRAPLTEDQFKRAVDHVYWAAENFHEMTIQARDTGVLRPPSEESRLEALFRRITALSPAARSRVRQELDAVILRATEQANAPEGL